MCRGKLGLAAPADLLLLLLQIQTFKDILIQKDNQLMQLSQMHEQELFRLAARSDASADLEQVPGAAPPAPPCSGGGGGGRLQRCVAC